MNLNSDEPLMFAAYLRFRREFHRMSREKLAIQCGVPASTIKKFERTGRISFGQFLMLWNFLAENKLTEALKLLRSGEGLSEDAR